MLTETGPLTAESASAVPLLSWPDADNNQDCRQADCNQEMTDTVSLPIRKNGGMVGGRRARLEPTVELRRFAWLVTQLDQLGIGQAEMARRTGIESSHINKMRNLETSGRTGLAADIIRRVQDGLKISPAYFFDAYEGERDFRLYELSAKRDEKRVGALEDTLAQMQVTLAAMNAQIAQQAAELAELRHAQSKLPNGRKRGQRAG